MPQVDNVLQTWHKLVDEKNPTALASLISDDAVFYSPAIPEPQNGKDITIMYLTAAFEVLGPTLEYVRELTSENNAVLEFKAEVNGTEVNGVDMFKWNEDGQIIDFKVMVRPLPALEVLKKAMKRQLVTMARAARDAEKAG